MDLNKKKKRKLLGGRLSGVYVLFSYFFISFLFPLTQMMYWTIKFPENLFDLQISNLVLNTLYLVILSSLVLIIFSLISNYGNRISNNKTLIFYPHYQFQVMLFQA